MPISQISALLEKNFKQLKNNKCNTFCNIIIPLILLFLLFFGRKLAQILVIQSLPVLKTDVPVLYNIPLYSKLKYSNLSAKTTNCEEWYLYDFIKEANNTKSKELFKTLISTKNMMASFCDDNPPQYNSSPYFLTPNEAKISENEKDINSYLYNRGIDLNHIPIKSLKKETSLTIVPDGAITIKNLNRTYFNYHIQIRDYKVSYYHRGSGVTLFYIFNDNTKGYEIFPSAITGSMWEIGIMNKAYMHELFPNITVVSGLQILPISPEDNEANVQKIVGVVTSGIYPISLSLLIPLFVYNIVHDKENKIFHLLRINGVKMRYYWISNFMLNYFIYIIIALFYVLFEAIFSGLKILRNTSPILIILTCVGWGFGLIGLSYFFQAYISRTKIAVVASLSIIFALSFFTLCFNLALYVLPREAPYILNIFPTFALYRIFHYLCYSCGFSSCISNLNNINNEMKFALSFLYLGGILFILLGIFLTDYFEKRNLENSLFYNNNKSKIMKEIKNKKKMITNIDEDNEDNDVKEKNIIEKDDKVGYELNNLLIDYPLNKDDINKDKEKIENFLNAKNENESLPKIPFIFHEFSDQDKNILDKFTLCLNKNEIFGLLDFQEEGKSSFYSILNRIYNNNGEGNIYINGNNISINLENIHELVGFLPKNDILWDDLTVHDTLLFYSKIKNGKKGKTKIFSMVKNILSKVHLDIYKNKLVGKLEERIKRRLSLGIALIGEPKLLFLEEPTYGLTPKNKRKIWNILLNSKEKTSMILNSYLMDEEENLCDRIGIISKGKLKYIGDKYNFINSVSKTIKLEICLQQYKKKKSMKNEENKLDKIIEEEKNEIENNYTGEEKMKKIKNYIKEIIPKVCSIFEEHRYSISFKIYYDELNHKLLFKKLEEDKDKLFIANWGVSQLNIEDVLIDLYKFTK